MTVEFAAVTRALLENALDQLAAGAASRVEVQVADGAVRVRDDGPGLPLSAHPQSGRPLVEVILTGPRRGPRNTLARVNAACLWLEVAVDADGEHWFQRYEWAAPTAAPERHGQAAGSGTTLVAAPGQGAPPTLADLEGWVRERSLERGQVVLAVGDERRELDLTA